MRFTLDHTLPGALCDVLGVVKGCGINLTKIETRPRGDVNWNYTFFIEMEEIGEKVKTAVEQMERWCIDIRVLGSYDS